MPQRLVLPRAAEKTSWSTLLALGFVLLAFLIVPLTQWWGVPLLLWVYTRTLPRWVPVWLQWGLVILVSGHLAVLADWSWGVALALTATTVANEYWENARLGSWGKLLTDIGLSLAWFLVAWWSSAALWWEANLVIIAALLLWLVYRQERT